MTSNGERTETVPFRARRDFWDTFDYYLLLCSGSAAIGGNWLYTSTGGFQSWPGQGYQWFLLTLGVLYFTGGLVTGACRT